MRHQLLLDSYITYVGLTRTKSTQQVHQDKLRPLLKYWDHLEPEDFTRAEFEAYLGYGKNERSWKPRTIQLLLTASKGWITWANDRDINVPNFIKGISKPQVHQGKVVFYSEDEIEKLLKHAKGKRIEIPVALGAHGSLRRTEIYNADWRDVDWDANVLTVHGTKVHEDRDITMSPTLRKVLRSHWRGQKRGRIIGNLSEAWKSNVRRDLRRLCKDAGVEYKALHSTRRSFATNLLLRGAPINVVQRLGGWRNLKTMSRYAGTDKGASQAAVNLLG